MLKVCQHCLQSKGYRDNDNMVEWECVYRLHSPLASVESMSLTETL